MNMEENKLISCSWEDFEICTGGHEQENSNSIDDMMNGIFNMQILGGEHKEQSVFNYLI